jgi:hypothetical protein
MRFFYSFFTPLIQVAISYQINDEIFHRGKTKVPRKRWGDILLPCRTGHTPSLVNYLSRREA